MCSTNRSKPSGFNSAYFNTAFKLWVQEHYDARQDSDKLNGDNIDQQNGLKDFCKLSQLQSIGVWLG